MLDGDLRAQRESPVTVKSLPLNTSLARTEFVFLRNLLQHVALSML